ncbi:MAG TPA: RICIN domain-containing protein [Ruminococcus sp.]
MKKSKSFSRLVSALTAFVVCLMILPLVKPDAVKAENRSGSFSTNYSLGNDPAQNMVNIAFAQEGKNGSQLGYNSDWCAWFVADCARLAGQDAIIPEKGRVVDLASAIKGERTSTPQVGDICIFDWNSVSGPYDHVEIVYKVSGSTVYTIGGNAGSTGNYKTNYVKTRNATATGQVQCYIHPYYNGAYTPENDDELGIPYPRPSGNPLLSTGSRGSGVSWLQTALNKANNAGLDVDGQFGSGTKQAVINFQKANGLEADGIAGPATVNKLVEVIKGQMNPTQPPSWSWISATDDRTDFCCGEQIHFWFSADETHEAISSYTIGINKEGERIITESCGRDYYISFDEPGNYSVYVSAYNSAGWADSNVINFRVIKNLPGSYLDVGTDFYAIISNVNTKYLLTNNNFNATFNSPTDEKNQYWYFHRNENGSYTIETYDRTNALDVANAETSDGTNIMLFETHGDINQQWYIYYAPNGGMYFKSALGNYVLDMNGGVKNGANANLWYFCESTAQVFEFYRIDLDGNMPNDIGEYFFAKIINTATGKALSNIYNANLAGENAEYEEEQTWCFVRMDNGSYKIMSYYDVDQSLDIVNFGTTNATNVGVCIDSDNIAQRFFLYNIDDDIYIKAMCSNNVFNMDLNTMNVSTWNYVKGVDPERFSIEKVDEEKYVKLEIISTPDKLLYNVGEKLNTEGLVIKQVYETGRSFTTTSGFTVDKNVLKLGDNKVTVTYEGKSTTFDITVNSLKGDINSDGEFNISDAVLLQKWILAEPNAKLADWKAADLCEDGKLDVFDLCMMKRMLIAKS